MILLSRHFIWTSPSLYKHSREKLNQQGRRVHQINVLGGIKPLTYSIISCSDVTRQKCRDAVRMSFDSVIN